MRLRLFVAVLCLAPLVGACGGEPQRAGDAAAIEINRARLLTDLRTLSADDMEGRETGTPGNERARDFIVSRFQRIGVEPLGEDFEHGFTFTPRDAPDARLGGINIIGRISGTSDSPRTLVLSAHYDHVGMREGQTWNGADDNASGVAALLAAASHFAANPPQHDILFVAFDAEEKGLAGAHAFVADPPLPLETLTFNLNLDMVAMSKDRTLWAVGTHHYPFLVPLVERVAERAPVAMPMGFDEPGGPPGSDWTTMTDSGAFHEAGIPFIYLGVDFHKHYHQPSDTYANMTLDFFQDAAAAIVDFAVEADRSLDEIGEAAGR